MEKSEYETSMKQVEKFLAKRKYVEALTLLKTMLDKEKENKEYLVEIYSKLSEAYYGKEGVRTENAITNLIESLKIRSELEQPDILALEMMNLAYLQDESGNLENAEKTLTEAMEVAEKVGDSSLSLSLKNALADILAEEPKRVDESYKLYLQIMEDSEKEKIWELYYEACVSLIKLYRDQQKVDQASELSNFNLTKADKILNSMKTKKEKEEFKEIISYLYDVSIDLAMENEDIGKARDLAEKFKGEK
jgi:tetratricopeptide (TPR) repeat protein